MSGALLSKDPSVPTPSSTLAPAPTPAPPVDPAAAAQASQIAAAAGVGGLPTLSDSTSGTETWGLQQYAAAPFDLSGLFGGTMKGLDAVNAFIAAGTGANPSLTASIQTALQFGDYYRDKTYQPTPGYVHTQDVQAFADMLRILGGANSTRGGAGQPPPIPVASYLENITANGVQNGSYSAANYAKQVVQPITLPNAVDLAGVAQKVAQQVLGQKLDAKEAAQFADLFRQNVANISHASDVAMVNAENSPAPLPTSDTTTPPALPHGIQVGAGGTIPTPTFGDNIGAMTGPLADQIAAAQGKPAALTEYTQENPLFRDASYAAENFVRGLHPQQAAQHDMAGQLSNFLSILSNPLSGGQ